uniref:Uncharacterized protein n=1 Tax=Glossina austeni TaxID=7395 RepID=A0A1A9V8N1_GLOAU
MIALKLNLKTLWGFLLMIALLNILLTSVSVALRCRTDDGPSEVELKRVTRNCMRKLSDNYMQTTLNGHQQNQHTQQHNIYQEGGRVSGSQDRKYDSSFPSHSHSYDYDDSYYDGNDNYEDNGGARFNFNFYERQSNNPNNNNNNNNNRQNYGNNRRSGSSVGSTNNDDYMAQRNHDRNANSRTNGDNGGDYSNYNQRNQFKSHENYNNNNNNNSTRYNNRYNNNKNSKNSNNNNSTDSFCLAHCFFEQMQMVGRIDYHQPTYLCNISLLLLFSLSICSLTTA